MQVTSDALFHFTKSISNLKNILTNRFGLTYCHEAYDLDYQTQDAYYPMVCFCDIPLSMSKNQISRYGSYAIGMTKNWAIKNKLNPVVYIEKNSLLAKDMQAAVDQISDIVNAFRPILGKVTKSSAAIVKDASLLADKFVKENTPEIRDNLIAALKTSSVKLGGNLESINAYQSLLNIISENYNTHSNLFRYVKNYQGKNPKSRGRGKTYRFYDEREWRFVPALNNKLVKNSISSEEFKNYRGSTKKKPFVKHFVLPFDADDIKYLLVKSDKDISPLIKTIKKIPNLGKSAEDIDILCTKIITYTQLKDDF